MKLSDTKKTFEEVVTYEAYDTYTVEADSEEEAQEIVMSGEADVEDRYEKHFEIDQCREIKG